MNSNTLTILFFILLIAACATSSNNDTEIEEVETTELEDIEQDIQVDAILKRDKERLDSMERVLLGNSGN
mgnify:FL=1